MGNVCSGLTKGNEEKSHTVSLQAYNEIRIIPPTPSPGFITSSSLADYEPEACSPDEVVIIKPPSKLAPLAEPETLSPAPPPKKEVTGAVVIPESPDSDTERLLSPQGDDLTQDAVDSELLLDDTPAVESPLITEPAVAAATAVATISTAAPVATTSSPVATTATVVASTTPIPDKILSNGFGISDDRIPLTDAEVLCEEDSPPISPFSTPRKSFGVAFSSPPATIVTKTDLAASSPNAADASSSSPLATSPPPPIVLGSPPHETPTPTTNAVEPSYSSQSQCREVDGSVNDHDSTNNVSGRVVDDNVNGHIMANDNVNGHVMANYVNCQVVHNNVYGDVNGGDAVNGFAENIEAIPKGIVVDTLSSRNITAANEKSVKQKTTTTTTTTTTMVEENGIRTENIDIEIIANGKSSPPLLSSSPGATTLITTTTTTTTTLPSGNDVNHNLNEDKAINGRRKDGDYFLEKTRNEENRIQTMCSTMEENLKSDLSDDVEGQIRAFIGKATLLTSKKFKQFKGLCKQNLEPEEGEAFKTTDEDLQGFWDLMTIQMEELDASYKDLLEFKSNNWTRPAKINESKSATNTPAGTRRKGAGAKKSTPVKSAEVEARNKAREEARRKLIAAKREAARNMEKSGMDGSETVKSVENGVTHVNYDGGLEDAELGGGNGLRRKKSLSFTIP